MVCGKRRPHDLRGMAKTNALACMACWKKKPRIEVITNIEKEQ
jgi:hypothetical protein